MKRHGFQLQVVELADRMVRSAFGAIEGGYVHNSESMFASNIVDMPQKLVGNPKHHLVLMFHRS